MASDFSPEGPGLKPDAAKYPPSAFGVRACKIPVVGRQKFIMDAASGENFSPLPDVKIVEVEKDDAAIYRREAKNGPMTL